MLASRQKREENIKKEDKREREKSVRNDLINISRSRKLLIMEEGAEMSGNWMMNDAEGELCSGSMGKLYHSVQPLSRR